MAGGRVGSTRRAVSVPAMHIVRAVLPASYDDANDGVESIIPHDDGNDGDDITPGLEMAEWGGEPKL